MYVCIHMSNVCFKLVYLVILFGLSAYFTFRSEYSRPVDASTLLPKPMLTELAAKLSHLGGGPSPRGLLSC